MSGAFNCHEYSLSKCNGHPNEDEKIPNFSGIKFGMQQERIDNFLNLWQQRQNQKFILNTIFCNDDV